MVLVNCLKISRVLTEREDLFNALDDIGIAWSEQKISLIKRHGKFKDTDQFVLNEIIRDMDRIREKRIREIVKLSKKSVSDVQKSKRNVEKLALRDMNNIQKIEKKNVMQNMVRQKGKKSFMKNVKIITSMNIMKHKENTIMILLISILLKLAAKK